MQSPWIPEFERTRPITSLTKNTETDILVVGGGIAGITTAYEILSRTASRVVLCEAGRMGEGASGFNAGQLVPDVERTLASLIEEFGEEVTSRLVIDLEQSWKLLDAFIIALGLTTPVRYFMGASGACSRHELTEKLTEEMLRTKLGAEKKLFVVRDDVWNTLTDEEKSFAVSGTKQQIQSMLEVRDERFIAAWSWSGGVSNSAELVNEATDVLLAQYPERFSVYEETPVTEIVLADSYVRGVSGSHEVRALTVVLATNGFESLTITNQSGPPLDSAFHYEVRGAVGFMAGYLIDGEYPPIAQAYFGSWDSSLGSVYDSEILEEPYFYLTRRPYKGKTLVVVGGPEDFVEDTRIYTKEYPYPKEALKEITEFLSTYALSLPSAPDFTWHGLMGYTRSGLRLVGPEPKHTRLVYNLGCNGIGLLPSLIAAKRLGDMFSGVPLEKSVFDPL
jgi:glycine/D-amino acid oxidase-like deaminating enzyme